MSGTDYVALPFVRTEEGIAPGQGQEMPNEPAAVRRAEVMSRDPENAGALAFKRHGVEPSPRTLRLGGHAVGWLG